KFTFPEQMLSAQLFDVRFRESGDFVGGGPIECATHRLNRSPLHRILGRDRTKLARRQLTIDRLHEKSGIDGGAEIALLRRGRGLQRNGLSRRRSSGEENAGDKENPQRAAHVSSRSWPGAMGWRL